MNISLSTCCTQSRLYKYEVLNIAFRSSYLIFIKHIIHPSQKASLYSLIFTSDIGCHVDLSKLSVQRLSIIECYRFYNFEEIDTNVSFFSMNTMHSRNMWKAQSVVCIFSFFCKFSVWFSLNQCRVPVLIRNRLLKSFHLHLKIYKRIRITPLHCAPSHVRFHFDKIRINRITL